jgi:lysozyme
MATRRRSNTNRSWKKGFIFLFILGIITLAATYGYDWWLLRKSRFVRYKEFGILIPENYAIHGIDVSRYQQTIAWDAVKAMKVKNIQLGFTFIKATEGIGNADPQFGRNWKKAKQAGVIRGAYHFFIASKDGKLQAENFISEVDLYKGDLPPVLDVEQLNGTPLAAVKKEVQRFLDVVENYYGVKPIIYSNVDFYKNYLGADFDKYPYWAAHYYRQGQPRVNRSWAFWQHSEEGRVNGILTKVDFNVFNGDSSDLQSLLIK